jgi:small subunit ribosomal protein S3
MGQKCSPTGFRTGITLGWQSTWFASKADYGNFLVEDQKIRDYIDKKYNRQITKGAVAKVEIARTRNDEIKVILHTARPGIVIGPRGGEVEILKEELEKMIGRKMTINVVEIKEPDLNAALVAEAIAEQLNKRASYRRVMKQFCETAVNAGAKGVKIICGGRLAGSEIARREMQKLGSIPLHTLDANVDYATATAHTTYGTIGVKVWIYRGKFGEEADVTRPTAPRRRGRRISNRFAETAAGRNRAEPSGKISPSASPKAVSESKRKDKQPQENIPANTLGDTPENTSQDTAADNKE